MKWPVIGGGSVLFIIILCLFLYGLHTSLWVMWNLLPNNYSFAVGLNQAFRKENILKMVPNSFSVVSSDVEAYMKFSNHIVWSHSNTEDVILLAPYPWKLMSVKNQLEQDGWNIEYVGAILQGTKVLNTKNTLPLQQKSLTQAVQAALSDIFHFSYPLNPLFIAKTEPFSILDQPIFAIGSVVGSTISVDILHGSQKQTLQSAKPFMRPHSSNEVVNINGSGATFNQLPDTVKNSLNELLSQKFGFIKKQPAFISHLALQQHIGIYANGADVAISIQDPSFIDTAHRWLQEEERRYRIERRAFSLPDKTRGFEYVPAEAVPIIQPDPTQPNCYVSSAGQIKAYICTKDTTVIFTNNLQLLDTLPSLETTEAYIQLGHAWLQRLGIASIEEAVLRSASPWTHLELKLSPK